MADSTPINWLDIPIVTDAGVDDEILLVDLALAAARQVRRSAASGLAGAGGVKFAMGVKAADANLAINNWTDSAAGAVELTKPGMYVALGQQKVEGLGLAGGEWRILVDAVEVASAAIGGVSSGSREVVSVIGMAGFEVTAAEVAAGGGVVEVDFQIRETVASLLSSKGQHWLLVLKVG